MVAIIDGCANLVKHVSYKAFSGGLAPSRVVSLFSGGVALVRGTKLTR